LQRLFDPGRQLLLLARGRGGVFFLRGKERWLTRSRPPGDGQVLWQRWDRNAKESERWQERSDLNANPSRLDVSAGLDQAVAKAAVRDES